MAMPEATPGDDDDDDDDEDDIDLQKIKDPYVKKRAKQHKH